MVKLTLNKTIRKVKKPIKSKKAEIKQKSKDTETDSESKASLNNLNSSEELALEFNLDRKPEDRAAVCFFCDGKFSEDTRGEQWVQCVPSSYASDYCK